MSMPDYDAGCYDDDHRPQMTVHRLPRAWQRINTVRKQQGVSLRKAARHLQTDVRTLRHEEEETTDLPISRLYEWQQVLEVPISELLIDSEAPLSSPVQDRARLVRVMKTVGAILEKVKDPCVKRMTQNLADMLVEMMPELKDVGAWHSVGQRRTLDEMGRIVERAYSEEVFRNLP